MPLPRRFVLPFLIVLLAVAVSVALPSRDVARGSAKQMGGALPTVLDAQQEVAQSLALADARVQSLIEGQRTEVMGVHPAGRHVPEAAAACLEVECTMVQIYDFDRNATVQAIVDTAAGDVLDVLLLDGVRPGINARLADRAREIAFNAPEVIEMLGEVPNVSDWQPMDANLLGTSCEGGHFCVAPSFRVGEYIMWAFVDLTTEEFVGISWTAPGTDEGSTAYGKPELDPDGCYATGTVNQNGWTMNYDTTASDGLRVADVAYNGQVVLTSAKLVEWHADYGSNGYQDSTGCGSGGGFPIRPIGDPTTQPIIVEGQTVGFMLNQTFSMNNWGGSCNYRYEQRYEFYNDGRFRVNSGAFGKGCGTNSLYRQIVRIDFAAGGTPGNDSVERWDGSAWAPVTTETRFTPAQVLTDPSTRAYRIMDSATNTGFSVEPGVGQWSTANVRERGDNPFVYFVQHKANEGDTDLGVFSAGCCNDNNHGPEIYVNSESIANQNVVMWYVPQMQTDAAAPDYYCWTLTPPETYPCYAGPMFYPIGGTPPVAPTAHFVADDPKPAGAPVTFENHTSGPGPISYSWDFGDGATSTETSPTHAYALPGTYEVTLTATNAGGSDSHTDTVTIIGEMYLPLILR